MTVKVNNGKFALVCVHFSPDEYIAVSECELNEGISRAIVSWGKMKQNPERTMKFFDRALDENFDLLLTMPRVGEFAHKLIADVTLYR